jgi:hypothetical protein
MYRSEAVVFTSHDLTQEPNGEHSALMVGTRKDEECACLSMQKSRADVTRRAESITSCSGQHGRVIVTVKRKTYIIELLFGMIARAMTLRS